MNNNIAMATQPQKKEQLLKELDLALNRKIQQKYSNNLKSQPLSTHSNLKQIINPDQTKPQTKQQTKLYRSKDYFTKSPINSRQLQLKKQSSAEAIKNKKQTEHLYQAILNKEIIISKPIQTEESQRQSYLAKNRQSFSKNVQQNVTSKQNLSMDRLKEENRMLQAELNQLKTCIKELENQSKRLRRQESQYLTLRQQNNSLKRQIEYLRNKIKSLDDAKNKQGSPTNLFLNLSQIMKKIMMQLNINFIDKQWTNEFVIQSLKNVSKGIYKLAQEKTKLNAKLNTFDIQTILAKESNAAYKKEIQELRMATANYQKQIEEYDHKIAKMQAEFEQALNQNVRVQTKYREIYKQLQCLKKEHKMVVQSYKHRKPKRQSYLKRQVEAAFDQNNTIVVSSLHAQIQTENTLSLQTNTEGQSNIEIKVLQQKITILQESLFQENLRSGNLQRQLSKIESDRTTQMLQKKQLEQTNLQNRIKLAQHEQKKYHYQCYIKQLEAKCEQISQDIANFMPQLKLIEEENNALRASSAQKDQDIIAKMQSINQLRDQNQRKQSQNQRKQVQIAILQKQGNSNRSDIQTLRKENHTLRNQNKKLNQLYKKIQDEMNEKHAEFEEQLDKTQRNMQNTFLSKIETYSQITNSKDNHLKNLQAEWKQKEEQFLKHIEKLTSNHQQFADFDQKVSSHYQLFVKQKNKLKQAVQQILILNNQVTKRQTQYQAQYNTVQNKLISLQTQNNLINQTYYQLELTSERAQQQLVRFKRQNDVLYVKNQNLTNQLAIQRLNLQKMKNEIGIYRQQTKQQQLIIRQLKAKNQQLSTFVQATLSETRRKQQSILSLQLKTSDLESNLSHLQQNQESKIHQIFMLQQRITNLANQNRMLFVQYQKFKAQAEEDSRCKTNQLSNQAYDIQRLIRENRELKTNLQQMNFLSSSKQFNKSELQTKLMMITEQNKSLAKKYQYLIEQLEVRQRSKEEDRYINQLKNKQYCLILRNILSGVVEMTDLENCSNFEELLQVGADRVINHKKDLRNLESLKKKELKKDSYHNQYQLQTNHQQMDPPRKFNFGIQINSFEDFVPQRLQNMNENQGNKEATVEQSPANSPRSFIFDLSPNSHIKEREQFRKSQFATQYLNTLNHHSTYIPK